MLAPFWFIELALKEDSSEAIHKKTVSSKLTEERYPSECQDLKKR
jgi:hypothetical protein